MKQMKLVKNSFGHFFIGMWLFMKQMKLLKNCFGHFFIDCVERSKVSKGNFIMWRIIHTVSTDWIKNKKAQ